ncbi:Aste57867_8686 [Aphanomyces stellatus]|uniref:Aste57867_8686 protein n=1 Tax=Aphanomyces stellatus TaxID=120398 RepID=A0A485KL31_9STRA|nr:hypothetical protein As57867_008652 [Aphanomyces stellatus]VFT85572.1 Aste57867_8686 [Aphanomyces stellatus]
MADTLHSHGAAISPASPSGSSHTADNDDTNAPKKKSTYCKEYYERNREKRIQQSKEYQRRNREKVQAYREQNREKELARMKVYNKVWYKQNREKVLARLKEYRKKNPEKEAKWVKDYRERNKEKINQRKRERYSRTSSAVVSPPAAAAMALQFVLNLNDSPTPYGALEGFGTSEAVVRCPEPTKGSLAFLLNA